MLLHVMHAVLLFKQSVFCSWLIFLKVSIFESFNTLSNLQQLA